MSGLKPDPAPTNIWDCHAGGQGSTPPRVLRAIALGYRYVPGAAECAECGMIQRLYFAKKGSDFNPALCMDCLERVEGVDGGP